MLSDGKISVDEAERLLTSMADSRQRRPEADPGRSGTGRPLESVTVVVDPASSAEAASDRDDTFTVGPSPRLVVGAENSRIEVHAGAEGSIRVQATLSNPGSVEYRATQQGDTVTVMARPRGKRSIFGWFGGKGHRIVVTAPPATTIDLESTNGRLEVRGVHGGGTVRTTNGRIDVRDALGDFEATTTNGRIEVHDLRGTASLQTTNGRISLDDVVGEAKATTTNGSISFEGELLPGGQSELVTSNGSVAVRLRATPSVRLDAATTNGSVASSITLTATSRHEKRRLVGVIGDGEAELVIRTTNGSVQID